MKVIKGLSSAVLLTLLLGSASAVYADEVQEYALDEKTRVFISPVYGSIDPADIVDFMIENDMNDVKLQLQLHKFIWDPEERGV